MLRRRSRLSVLAEIGEQPQDGAGWGLRRSTFESLGAALPSLEGLGVLLVTGGREETPTVATAVAATASAAGRRTLLLECDLAQPSLAARLGLEPAPGLHEYLRWEAEPRDVLQPLVLAGSAVSSEEPLVCVCGGRPASKPETLLGLQSFGHMIAKLRAAYELVVIAAAPADTEPGPCLAAAHHADAVVAALPAEGVKRRVAYAIRRLPVSALGAIVVQ
jgi:polysaccharide biosynthesis transport protein